MRCPCEEVEHVDAGTDDILHVARASRGRGVYLETICQERGPWIALCAIAAYHQGQGYQRSRGLRTPLVPGF